MKKVMVWNFETEKYEEASAEAAKALLALIDANNQDCIEAHKEQEKKAK